MIVGAATTGSGPRRTAVMDRRNPSGRLIAMLVLSFALLFSTDPVVAGTALVLELATVPLFGIGYGALLRRCWPLLLSAAGVGVTQLLFGTSRDGDVPLLAAVGIALRVLAVALPGVLVFATMDPTALADSLVQQLRVPARFAIGALAALRLLPLLTAEWQTLVLARRARGVDAGRNPVARARLLWSTLFSLLVGAIRRGTRLATAMDARGFSAGTPRSIARPQRFRTADAALIAAAAGLAGVALSVGALVN